MACVLFCVFLCVVFALLYFQLNIFQPRGAVGDATFRTEYLSFPRLTSRYANDPREGFGMTSPLY